jgi:hypothetical protein
VEFISDKVLYVILRGRWCNVIILNADAQYEHTEDDVKDSLYGEIGCVFIIFLGTNREFYWLISMRK